MTVTVIRDTALCGLPLCNTSIDITQEIELNYPDGKVVYVCDECFQYHTALAEIAFHECIQRGESFGIKMPQDYKDRMKDVYYARYGVLSPAHPRFNEVMAAATTTDTKKGRL